MIDNFLYPNHPVRCIMCGLNSPGKSVFLTNLILNIINEYKKNIATHLVYSKIYIKG